MASFPDVVKPAVMGADVQPEIVTTFLAMAGPAVRRTGAELEMFSDHTDIRPTILAILA